MSKIHPLSPQQQNGRMLTMIKKVNDWFDSTVGNFPLGAAISLCITVVGSVMISSGFQTCNVVLSEYNTSMDRNSMYLFVFLGLLNLLHFFVFVHGALVGWLETSRELFHAKEVGCFCGACKDRHSQCGRVCRKVQRCNQVSCQVFWAICGTFMIFCYYTFALGFFTVSTTSTVTAFVLTKACHSYEQLVETNVERTRMYLDQAKEYVGKVNNVTQGILYQYSQLVALQDMAMQANPMEQVNEVPTPTYFEMPQKRWGRQLVLSKAYDPVAALTQGQSVLATLNQTILHTQERVDVFDSYLKHTVKMCVDYANLYNNLYIISVGSFLLLLSHFLIFGVHCKYFSVWNYEARLIKNGDYE